MWKGQQVFKLKDAKFCDDLQTIQNDSLDDWEEIFVNPDKRQGTLRYTTNAKEAEEEQFKMTFKELHEIEVQESKVGQYYYAQLVSVDEVRERKKNSCARSQQKKKDE